MLQKNKRKMFYALFDKIEDEYVLDNDGNKIVIGTDSQGNEIYKKTGDKVKKYFEPVIFFANIKFSGEIYVQEFGIDVSNYDAVMVTAKDSLPINETSLIWYENEPQYKDEEHLIVEPKSADYKVMAVKKSLNQDKFILQKIVK